MILIGRLDSPYVRRIAVTLHHYEIDFQRQGLSIFGDQAAVRAINPLGKVPALQLDDGETLFDSHMIIDYLDERAGTARSLTPASGPARREILQTTAVALGVAEKSIAASAMYQEAAGAANTAWIDRCRSQITSALDWLSGRPQNPWLNGEHFSQADVAFACAWGHLTRRNPDMDAANVYPALEVLAAGAESLPAFRAHPFTDG